MPKGRFKEKTWEDYEYKGYFMWATEDALRQTVRKAAKAANQRLLRRERAGRTKGIYAGTMAALNKLGRRRFAESKSKLAKMDINELRHEYILLRDWLSAKTSTIQGLKESDDKRFMTARARGFTGSQEEWNDLVTSFFTEEIEKYFSSNVIYQQLTSNNADLITKIMDKHAKKNEEPSKGQLLVELIKASGKRTKRRKKG